MIAILPIVLVKLIAVIKQKIQKTNYKVSQVVNSLLLSTEFFLDFFLQKTNVLITENHQGSFSNSSLKTLQTFTQSE